MEFVGLLFNFVMYFVVYCIAFVATLIVGAIIGGVPVLMKNDTTGHAKYVRPRISFTYLFFGSFVPLFRAHWSSFGICLILDIVSFGFGKLIYAFFINKTYINHLENKGYEKIVVTYNVQSTVVNSTTGETTTENTTYQNEEGKVNIIKPTEVHEEDIVAEE